MPVPKIVFFDTKPYDREFFESENSNFGFNIKYVDTRLAPDTISEVKGFNVLCIFVNDVITKEMISPLKDYGVELVALRCAGYNNIDLRSIFDNIHTVRVPAYSPYAVAEYAVMLMLALNRKIHKACTRIRDNNFTLDGLLGFDLHGKTAGIIGTGKIGRVAAKILKGFGMEVLLYDVKPDNEFAEKMGIRYVSLDEVYSKSDVISLHCPLTPKTHHMLNESSFLKMKNGVMVINTGRGALIDAKALIIALKDGKIGYAGLDVYEEESEYFFEDFSSSFISDDTLARLMTFPNVIITSHQAFFTKEALKNIANTTLSNIKDYFSGKYLANEICYKCERKECLKKQKQRCF
ncbi:MAG: 2-hydroxyacid dehydrogenase [Candidatus Omnitrophota bacterium]|nr:2-hydroxyacid dehydrogenase [Candidatus Omnitrophota bacterium]MBU1894391.1 2-hydroxyacid dehydrogenase [Candidatus Omnitrophota bacterium]